jgi:hypothetical protein
MSIVCSICGETYWNGAYDMGDTTAMTDAWAEHMKVHSRLRKMWAKVLRFPRWLALRRFQKRCTLKKS